MQRATRQHQRRLVMGLADCRMGMDGAGNVLGASAHLHRERRLGRELRNQRSYAVHPHHRALVQGAGEQNPAVAFEQPVAAKRCRGAFYEGATRVKETEGIGVPAPSKAFGKAVAFALVISWSPLTCSTRLARNARGWELPSTQFRDSAAECAADCTARGRPSGRDLPASSVR